MTNDQRMVDIRLLEFALRVMEIFAPDYEEWRIPIDKPRAIISGPGVEPVAWSHWVKIGGELCMQWPIAGTKEEAEKDLLMYSEGDRLGAVVRPLYLAAPSALVQERGPWRASVTAEERPRTFIESDDFTHDVRLYVDGDFSDQEQRMAYAQEIANRLNQHGTPVQAVPDGVVEALQSLKEQVAAIVCHKLGHPGTAMAVQDAVILLVNRALAAAPQPPKEQQETAMTITREQLELAARAAGIELDWYTVRTGGEPDAFDEWVCDIKGTRCMWNPLTDHGQLLDLAMACGMSIDFDIGALYPRHSMNKFVEQRKFTPGDFNSFAEAVITAAAEQQQAKEKKE